MEPIPTALGARHGRRLAMAALLGVGLAGTACAEASVERGEYLVRGMAVWFIFV